MIERTRIVFFAALIAFLVAAYVFTAPARAGLQKESGPQITKILDPKANISQSSSYDSLFISTAGELNMSAVTTHVTVNATHSIRTADSRFFGINTAQWDSDLDTASTNALLNDTQVTILRYPGGSWADLQVWPTNITPSDVDKFASVATNTHAQAMITVNYGSSTAQAAASWVGYSNITKGYGFKYWEVGNENYGSWEHDTHPRPHDPYTYAQEFNNYITQMKAVDSSIKVGAVIITGEDAYANYTDHPATNMRTGQVHNGWTPVLLSTMRALGVTPDFVVYHRYEQQPGEENDANLLASSDRWSADAGDLRRQLDDYLGASASNVEILCTEYNSVAYNPGKQTTSLVDGLLMADSLGQIMKTEFNSYVWWDLHNNRLTGNNNSSLLYGWRLYGDYGILSRNTNEPYPSYYVFKLLKNFARGGEQVVEATSDNSLLATYAVRRADNGVSLLVVNKSPSNSFNTNVDLLGYSPNANVDIYSYGITQDEAARTGSGSPDVAQTTISVAGSTFSYTYPPYSVTVLKLRSNYCWILGASSKTFTPAGGNYSLTITAQNNCNWMATSNASWITVNSGGGLGDGSVSLSIAPNTNTSARTGTLSVGVQTFTVMQGAAFNDVPTSDPFYEYISELSARGITLGCGGGNYCPNASVTREQMAAFIMRALGEFNPPTPPSQRFNDVPPSNPFYNFIDRLAALQITLGCGNGNYCPTDNVTREQMAAFIIRALGEFNPPPPVAQRFTDVPSSNPFYSFIDRMATLHITIGCGAGNYCPTQPVTRGQMAAFIVRAFITSNTSSCSVQPSLPVGWWPGDGNPLDIRGGNNGSLLGGVTYGSGKVSQAFVFDGIDDYVQIADASSLKPANITIEGWVRFNSLDTPNASLPGLQYIVFKKNSRNSGFEGYTILKFRGAGVDYVSFGITSASGVQKGVSTQSGVTTGQFYHVAATYDGSVMRLYLDGVLQGVSVANFPLDYGNRPLFFGSSGEGFDGKFSGQLDELTIYNRALTPQEIQTIYSAGSMGKCK